MPVFKAVIRSGAKDLLLVPATSMKSRPFAALTMTSKKKEELCIHAEPLA